uniref:Uncharacterized protein n=1 Tax=Anguilla anguilla TaxID=7936 RepID=A0A0E9UA14_ANGAN
MCLNVRVFAVSVAHNSLSVSQPLLVPRSVHVSTVHSGTVQTRCGCGGHFVRVGCGSLEENNGVALPRTSP